MTFKNGSILCLIFVLTIACSDFKSQEKFVLDRYQIPNIDSLLRSQILGLNGKNITKRVILNGSVEESNFESDTVFWKSELSVFSELEINKSSLIGAYNTERINAFELSYIRKQDENKGADFVNIKRSKNGNLNQLSGTIKAINYLYSSEQNLNLNFNQTTGLIENYTFSGFQKLISNDTVFFEIMGTID